MHAYRTYLLAAAAAAVLLAPLAAGAQQARTNGAGATAAQPPQATATAGAGPTGQAAAAPSGSAATAAPRFTDEAAAQAHCPGDAVVWVNARSGAVHRKGDRYYGNTRSGAYACQSEVPARTANAARSSRSRAGTTTTH